MGRVLGYVVVVGTPKGVTALMSDGSVLSNKEDSPLIDDIELAHSVARDFVAKARGLALVRDGELPRWESADGSEYVSVTRAKEGKPR